jgi:8-oxo-dGTP pyrophosphatase MutT (NUDIX family)
MDNDKINLNMNNDKINLNMDNDKINLNIKKKKTFKSASLTFYSIELGYLICEEFRYKEKKTLLHTIGGKVENYDNDIFSTAIREFIEETNLESHPKINLTNKKKNDLIEVMIDYFYEIAYYKDACVGKKNNYFHRYYMIMIDDIQNIDLKKSIIELPVYFNDNYKTEIDKIIWYNLIENKNINKLSWLTKIFFNLIIK